VTSLESESQVFFFADKQGRQGPDRIECIRVLLYFTFILIADLGMAVLILGILAETIIRVTLKAQEKLRPACDIALMPSKFSKGKGKGKGKAWRLTPYRKMQLECDTLHALEAAEAQALKADASSTNLSSASGVAAHLDVPADAGFCAERAIQVNDFC
jgi:hypothetical protein